MANQLRMDQRQAIAALSGRGWSRRQIARELGLHRNTVRRYFREQDGSKCTISRTGSEEAPGAKCTNVRAGKVGRVSQCEPFAAVILEKLAAGLSAQRIFQDLRLEHGFGGSDDSVQRFVHRLKAKDPQRVWRMECQPGEEAQVDYVTAWALEGENGRLKKLHVLRVTLSHSRKSYSEAMAHQDCESFIRALENAFRHFGGVPQRLCPDNLKAAVTKADWYDPQLNPKIVAFAAHYGVAITPTRPYCPEHKGKVERAVGYVKNNALKGRRFRSLAEVNEHLRWWEREVADRRIHGTTKKQVGAHFLIAEKHCLRPLPIDLFPSFAEAPRQVHRDSYVEVRGAYYEVPEEYIGRQVWVRWDAAMVRVFNARLEPIAAHSRLPAGRFTRSLGVEGTRGSVAQSTRYYRLKVGRFGPAAGAWADAIIAQEPLMAIRRMQGLLQLNSKHCGRDIEQACSEALLHGHYRIREIKNHLAAPGAEQGTLAFLQQHELIRDLQDYSRSCGIVGEDLFHEPTHP